MEWQLRDDSVYIRTGINNGNHIAAFDFDNTLAWSDSGLIFMRTEDDWISTTSSEKLVTLFTYFAQNNWTIVIFINQLENNREYTRTALSRIDNFMINLQIVTEIIINPYIYVAIRNDNNRKPNIGMWNMFIQDSNLVPSAASFYCGDAFGPLNPNPLYQWGDSDSLFATNINLAYYTPDEILGVYEVPVTVNGRILFIMAAQESQYRYFIDELKQRDPLYIESNLANAVRLLEQGNKVIIVGERLATRGGRQRITRILPTNYWKDTQILMFTRPIKPFIGDTEYKQADLNIRGYANALDIHLKLNGVHILEAFPIIRIN